MNFKYFYQLNVIFLLIVILFGCSSTQEPVPVPITKVYDQQPIKFNWKKDYLSTSIAGSFVPVLDANAIFTADQAGYIYRIDKTDGDIISKFKLKRKLSSGTATSNDSIFVTTEDGYLLSVDKVNGKINWQTQLPTVSIEAPQYGGGFIIVRTNDAQVLAFDASNGNLVWVYFKQVPPLTLRTYNTFQVVGSEVVLIGQPGGRVILVNLQNGTTIWETYIAVPEGATDLDKLTDVSARPSIDGKEVCVVTFNGKIGCIDAMSSNIMWSRPFSSSYGILIDTANVYALSEDGISYAFDRNYEKHSLNIHQSIQQLIL